MNKVFWGVTEKFVPSYFKHHDLLFQRSLCKKTKSYPLKFNIAAGQRWKSTKKSKTNQVVLNTFIWRLNCFYHLLSQYGIHVYIGDGIKLLCSQIKVSIITWSTLEYQIADTSRQFIFGKFGSRHSLIRYRHAYWF